MSVCVCVCVRLSGVRLGGPAPPGHLHAVPHGAHGVEGRTHVQDGELVRVLVDFSVVVVDDVAHFLPAAVYDPVVAVKRQLVAEEVETITKCMASTQNTQTPKGLTPSSVGGGPWARTLWLCHQTSSRSVHKDTHCRRS